MNLLSKLIALGVQPSIAREAEPHLQAALRNISATTVEREAAFISQILVESAYLAKREENLYYTTEAALTRAFGSRVKPHIKRLLRNPKAIANFAYANRNGNGDEASGDGWFYRGGGYLGLTGAKNYAAQGYAANPEVVRTVAGAAQSAAQFWKINNVQAKFDAGGIDAATLAVNGKAMLDAKLRATLYKKYIAL